MRACRACFLVFLLAELRGNMYKEVPNFNYLMPAIKKHTQIFQLRRLHYHGHTSLPLQCNTEQTTNKDGALFMLLVVPSIYVFNILQARI